MINKLQYSAQFSNRNKSSIVLSSDHYSYVNKYIKCKLIKHNNGNNSTRSSSCNNTKQHFITTPHFYKHNSTKCYSQSQADIKYVPLSQLKEYQVKTPMKSKKMIPGYKRKDLSGYLHFSNANKNNLLKVEHMHDICIKKFVNKESCDNMLSGSPNETIKQELLSNISTQLQLIKSYQKFPMNICDVFLHITKQNVNYVKHLIEMDNENVVNEYRYKIILKNMNMLSYVVNDYVEKSKEINFKSRNAPTINMNIVNDIINENISIVGEIMKEGVNIIKSD